MTKWASVKASCLFLGCWEPSESARSSRSSMSASSLTSISPELSLSTCWKTSMGCCVCMYIRNGLCCGGFVLVFGVGVLRCV